MGSEKLFAFPFFRKVALVSILAFLPFFCLAVFWNWERAQSKHLWTEETLADVVHVIGIEQVKISEAAHSLIAVMERMYCQDEPICNITTHRQEFTSLFQQLHQQRGFVVEGLITTEQGQVLISAEQIALGKFFRNGLLHRLSFSQNSFAVGEVGVSLSTGEPLFYFGHKFFFREDMYHVLVCGVRLDIYGQLARDLILPQGSHLYLTDAYGKIVYSNTPGPKQGVEELPTLLYSTVLDQVAPQGRLSLDTPIGEFFVAYERLTFAGSPDTYMYVILALPEEQLAPGTSWPDVWEVGMSSALFVFLLVALALAAYRYFFAPLEEVYSLLRRMANGDYSGRARYYQNQPELTDLAGSVNELAVTLEAQRHSLALAQEKTIRASREKTQFLANMSHEIRTPMNSIIGMAYLALKSRLTKQQNQYVAKIHNSAQDLLRIIGDMLEFSRMDTGYLDVEHIRFSIKDVFFEVRHRFEVFAQAKGITLMMVVSPAIPQFCEGDPLRLGQVIGHLVDNAIRYSSQGTVEVSCDLVETDGQQVSLVISVKDTGKGIGKDTLTFIQRMFSEVLPTGLPTATAVGSPLGLLLSCRIISLMGGHMAVTSHPGIGSVFQVHITLPVLAGESVLYPSPTTKVRVLVVQDSEVAEHDFLTSCLQNFGMRVDIAPTVESLPTLLETADAEYDPYRFVLLYWHLTEQDALELCAGIKNELLLREHPFTILLSSLASARTEAERVMAGIDAFLTKPVDEFVLYDTIMNLLYAQDERFVFANRSGHSVHSPYSLKGLHMLVVDDNAINQQIAEDLLLAMGARIGLASNGQEALTYLQKHMVEDPVHLVFMDLEMPGMNGFEAIQRIRFLDYGLDLPIIAMTAHSRNSSLGSIDEAGFNDYIPKPIMVESLQAAVLRWLPVERVDDPNIALIMQDMYQEIVRGDGFAAMGTLATTAGLLEQYLKQGRLLMLQDLLLAGRFSEAAAWLFRINSSLQFMQDQPL